MGKYSKCPIYPEDRPWALFWGSMTLIIVALWCLFVSWWLSKEPVLSTLNSSELVGYIGEEIMFGLGNVWLLFWTFISGSVTIDKAKGLRIRDMMEVNEELNWQKREKENAARN